MKKILAAIILLLTLAGCSSSDAVDYSKVIDTALKGNAEMIKEYDWSDRSAYERDSSNIMVWEDENNYYVYFRKNVDGEKNDYIKGDGYKIGKSNDKWSSSPADRSQIMSYLKDNEPPVYEENNIELVNDNYDMR